MRETSNAHVFGSRRAESEKGGEGSGVRGGEGDRTRQWDTGTGLYKICGLQTCEVDARWGSVGEGGDGIGCAGELAASAEYAMGGKN